MIPASVVRVGVVHDLRRILVAGDFPFEVGSVHVVDVGLVTRICRDVLVRIFEAVIQVPVSLRAVKRLP